MSDLAELLQRHVKDPTASWSVGSFGAVAEFLHDEDETATITVEDEASAIHTARGGLRVRAVPKLRPLAYEHATGKGSSWSQTLAFCLPEDACAMAGRDVLTELGPDIDALREEDRASILFDLGLAQHHADICIRTGDAALLATLRDAAGRSLFEPGNPAMGAIVAAGPHRVFVTRAARGEVYQPIPPADGTSPIGPHTHILPQLLKSGQSHAATAPIPQGWVPVLNLFPAHPGKGMMGEAIAFQPERRRAFEELLARYGVPELWLYKRQVIELLEAGRDPTPPSTRFEKSTLRATQRQLAGR